MTSRTYGPWHALAEAVPARGMLHDVEVEFEDGTKELRRIAGECTFLSKVGVPVVRWRVAREQRPDKHGWWLLADVQPTPGQLVMLHGRGILVTHWCDGAEHIRGPHSSDPEVIKQAGEWTHWKAVELPEGCE